MAKLFIEEITNKLTAKKINKRLFDDLYNLFDFWDISLWEDTPMSELAEIWCEVAEEGSLWGYSEKKRKQKFVDKIIERLVD